jgi:hypothetical protein
MLAHVVEAVRSQGRCPLGRAADSATAPQGVRLDWLWRGAALGVVLCAISCARLPGTDANGGAGDGERDLPLIGLQRGGRWSVLSVRPPHLTGPNFHLMLKNSTLSGQISVGVAPGGSVHVAVAADGAEGYGPLGPVSLDFFEEDERVIADGTWNGGRVHLEFAQDSLNGTVATNSQFAGRSTPGGPDGLTPMRSSRSNRWGGTSNPFMPAAMDASCEYFLTERGRDGALTGGSICGGMPQQTRLEVPNVAQAWMTRAELLTVLVAVLSAPPVVAAEDYGPRFEQPSSLTAPRR